MQAKTTLALLAGCTLLLSACGNKGSLTQPPRPAPAQDKAAKAAPAPQTTATPPAAAINNNSAPPPASKQ